MTAGNNGGHKANDRPTSRQDSLEGAIKALHLKRDLVWSDGVRPLPVEDFAVAVVLL